MNRYRQVLTMYAHNLEAAEKLARDMEAQASAERERLAYREYLKNYKGKRDNDPGTDCDDFVEGPIAMGADCDTDGHYMCDQCKWNPHQNASQDEVDFRFSTGFWPTKGDLDDFIRDKDWFSK